MSDRRITHFGRNSERLAYRNCKVDVDNGHVYSNDISLVNCGPCQEVVSKMARFILMRPDAMPKKFRHIWGDYIPSFE